MAKGDSYAANIEIVSIISYPYAPTSIGSNSKYVSGSISDTIISNHKREYHNKSNQVWRVVRDTQRGVQKSYLIIALTRIRNLLDPISPPHLGEPVWRILDRLMANEKVANAFEYDSSWLYSINGTQYYGAKKKDSAITMHGKATEGYDIFFYAHTIPIPTLAYPDKKKVLILELGFIRHQDGSTNKIANGMRLAIE